MREARSLACGASHCCVESVGGVQVAVVAGRGCGVGVRSLSYRAEISRASPTAIVMVMDQSASMNHRLKSGQSKAAFLADVLNKTLYTLITSCSKAEGVRDYFHVGVVAYGGEEARNGFQGALDGEALYAVSRLAEAPLRVETRAKKVAGPNGDVVEQSVRFPIWFEPRSHGKTAMCAGLNAAIGMLEQWRDAHPSAYPPSLSMSPSAHATRHRS